MNPAQWATFLDACEAAGSTKTKSAGLKKLQGELDYVVVKKFGSELDLNHTVCMQHMQSLASIKYGVSVVVRGVHVHVSLPRLY